MKATSMRTKNQSIIINTPTNQQLQPPTDNQKASKTSAYELINNTENKLNNPVEYLNFTYKLFEILNNTNGKSDTICDIVSLIKEFTNYEAIGVRLKEGEDYPYYVSKGFPSIFVKAENSLCTRENDGEIVYDSNGKPYLECMCGNVISGRTDPSLPFFTKKGSFWSNSTTKLLASTSADKHLGRTRNRCNSCGYESVALIPLKSGDEIIGILQINDKRENVFTTDLIEFFEGVGSSIGIALNRNKSEEKIHVKSQFLENVLESLTHPFFIINADNYIIEKANTTGKSLGNISKNTTCYEFSHNRKKPCNGFDHPCPIDEIKKIKKPIVFEHTQFNKNGEKRYVNIHAYPIFDNDGNVSRIIEYSLDITEQKLAVKELKKSEKRYREMFNSVMEGICFVDDKEIIKYANPAFVEIFGEKSANDMHDKLLLDYFSEKQRKQILLETEKRTCGESSRYEIEMTTADGVKKILYASISPRFNKNNKYIGAFGTVLDITDRKQAEVALQESENHLQSMIRVAPTGIGVVIDRQLMQVNDRMCEIIGYTTEELIGQSARILYPTDEIFEYVGREKYAQIQKHGTGTVEVKMQHKNGKIIDVLLSSTPLDLDDLSKGVTFTVLDITDRKQAEELIRESEEKFRCLVESSSDWIWEVNVEGIYTYASPQVESILGYKPEEIIGKSPFDLMPPSESVKINAIFQDSLLKTKPIVSLENICLHKDGRQVVLQTSGIPVLDVDGNIKGYRGIDRDVTEHKLAEESLREYREELEDLVEKRTSELKTEISDRVMAEKELKKYREHLEILIEERTSKLKQEIDERKHVEINLEKTNKRLTVEQESLKHKNIALNEVMNHIESEKKQTNIQIHDNLNKIINPIINALRIKGNRDINQYIDLLENSLNDITSPFTNNLGMTHDRLTPRELEVCNMVKNGMSSKDIATILNTSIYTVHNQRKNIRKKLGIKGNNSNLTTCLKVKQNNN